METGKFYSLSSSTRQYTGTAVLSTRTLDHSDDAIMFHGIDSDTPGSMCECGKDEVDPIRIVYRGRSWVTCKNCAHRISGMTPLPKNPSVKPTRLKHGEYATGIARVDRHGKLRQVSTDIPWKKEKNPFLQARILWLLIVGGSVIAAILGLVL